MALGGSAARVLTLPGVLASSSPGVVFFQVTAFDSCVRVLAIALDPSGLEPSQATPRQ